MSELEKELFPYKTVMRDGEDEIVEKKSRFIAHVKPVTTEEEALQFIEELKKKYWDARHNCYAYIIGKNAQVVRFSDDGEPSGTAGKPILEVLQNQELRDVVVVVTRYFGGVLLGTGGLVRAYTQSTQVGLNAAQICTMTPMVIITTVIDYTLIGKIKYVLAQNDALVQDEEYGADVTITFGIPSDKKMRLIKELIETTNGKIEYEEMGVEYMAL